MTTAATVGQKLWNYCNVLRDAGLSYGDYLEQLTYLIFLKMMHERSLPPYTLLPDYQPPPIPEGYDWPSLMARAADELETHYRRTLETLARQPGTLGVIFSKAQNKVQEPAMLERLIKELIDSENWLSLSADVKGDAYESLLEAQRPGRQDRRRSVFHAPPSYPGNRRCDASPTGHFNLRSCLRDRRIPVGGPPIHLGAQPEHGPGPVGPPAGPCPPRLGDCR